MGTRPIELGDEVDPHTGIFVLDAGGGRPQGLRPENNSIVVDRNSQDFLKDRGELFRGVPALRAAIFAPNTPILRLALILAPTPAILAPRHCAQEKSLWPSKSLTSRCKRSKMSCGAIPTACRRQRFCAF
jgi:hypothetical protein